MSTRGLIIGVAIAALAVLGFMSVFTVHQTEQALVLQFGNPKRAVVEPGLQFKSPIENVERYDRRILALDPPVQEVLLSDQKRINVDSFARWRIVDPLEFRKRASNINNFRQIFGQRLNSAVRAEMAKVPLVALLTEGRATVMSAITDILQAQAQEFGIEVVDVRVGRTDLPPATAEAVYRRMQSDRIAAAAELRAEGAELKAKKEAEADRTRTVILAEATRTAEILRGEGEGERNRILADAYGQDPEFFAFYRSMQAYREALADGTTLVLTPDSDFFRYFGRLPKSRPDDVPVVEPAAAE